MTDIQPFVSHCHLYVSQVNLGGRLQIFTSCSERLLSFFLFFLLLGSDIPGSLNEFTHIQILLDSYDVRSYPAAIELSVDRMYKYLTFSSSGSALLVN